ncbi:nucleotidyltransferase family protein [Polaribacter sp. Z022]|uniref:nucleotidyltransferase family protein n=1 Tax=Polaribacter sp. Z022 TaxID=2927125 RepID=UPI0020225FC7|nr:nucleotidyltransferase family protein [Polaribacter sp. Z022]MCL7753591.1 nucleotidyltransferase family protein [Polaribacter sp. Z022]
MNYKETLFFVGKCLTINHEEKNKVLVEEKLKSLDVDWESIVKISTAHFVFPALYCNLKKANFLHYLPEELVNYMIHITDLNRERNQEIIEQAKEINDLLLANNITPIFLKGTGNLLEGLYDDIAERMVGDIDFLVSENDFLKSVELLKKINYERVSKGLASPIFQKHYPRLFNKNKLAAVEVHLKIIRDKSSLYFSYETLNKNFIKQNNYTFLSFKDQITLTTLAIQHNDYGYYYKSLSFRNSYDLFLLSLKENNLKCLNNKNFYKLLNSYFLVSNIFFNSNIIKFKKTNSSKLYYKILELKLKNSFFNKLHTNIWKLLLFIRRNYLGTIRFIMKRKFRKYYLKRIFS